MPIADLPPIVITDDRGGLVRDYAERRQQYQDEGRRIIIDGLCGSACLLLIIDTTCATNRAELQFHEATDRNGQRSEPTTRMLRTLLPAALKRWVDKRGGLTNRVLTMRAPQIFNHLPRCGFRGA